MISRTQKWHEPVSHTDVTSPHQRSLTTQRCSAPCSLTRLCSRPPPCLSSLIHQFLRPTTTRGSRLRSSSLVTITVIGTSCFFTSGSRISWGRDQARRASFFLPFSFFFSPALPSFSPFSSFALSFPSLLSVWSSLYLPVAQLPLFYVQVTRSTSPFSSQLLQRPNELLCLDPVFPTLNAFPYLSLLKYRKHAIDINLGSRLRLELGSGSG